MGFKGHVSNGSGMGDSAPAEHPNEWRGLLKRYVEHHHFWLLLSKCLF